MVKSFMAVILCMVTSLAFGVLLGYMCGLFLPESIAAVVAFFGGTVIGAIGVEFSFYLFDYYYD